MRILVQSEIIILKPTCFKHMNKVVWISFRNQMTESTPFGRGLRDTELDLTFIRRRNLRMNVWQEFPEQAYDITEGMNLWKVQDATMFKINNYFLLLSYFEMLCWIMLAWMHAWCSFCFFLNSFVNFEIKESLVVIIFK